MSCISDTSSGTASTTSGSNGVFKKGDICAYKFRGVITFAVISEVFDNGAFYNIQQMLKPEIGETDVVQERLYQLVKQ